MKVNFKFSTSSTSSKITAGVLVAAIMYDIWTKLRLHQKVSPPVNTSQTALTKSIASLSDGKWRQRWKVVGEYTLLMVVYVD